MSEPINQDQSIRKSVEDAITAREEDSKFELALGRFMIAWSDAELELYRSLIAYSQVSDPIARALFSGTRAKAMIDFIRSIAHNTNMAAGRRSDLEYVFTQMSAINSMRDHLVHHSSNNYSYDDPKKRIIANTRASKYGNAKGYEVSVETIHEMALDLYKIANHLNMHWGLRTEPFQAWREDSQLLEPAPWHYKSLQPIPSWEKT